CQLRSSRAWNGSDSTDRRIESFVRLKTSQSYHEGFLWLIGRLEQIRIDTKIADVPFQSRNAEDRLPTECRIHQDLVERCSVIPLFPRSNATMSQLVQVPCDGFEPRR